jgi:Ran GTPase-activating protein (RanGAP) involved in mRNA processing and transport
MFRNGEGLLDKLNGLNAWCRVTELRLNECKLGEGGAQAIAAALRVNHTLTNLNLDGNQVGEGVQSAVRQSWGNRGGTLELD